jgi:hypothetical protein
MQVKHKARLAALAAALAASQASWAEGTLTAGTGYNYSKGNYGTTTSTEITSIPFSLAYDTGPWTMKLTVPYIRITGASDVVAGVGRARRSTRGVPITTTTIRTTSGMGDVVAAATYNFYNDSATQMGADITGKIKFGTASADDGLGTGKNDYIVMLDVYKKLTNQWTLFGGIGYSVLGSTVDVPLRNAANLSLGASYKVNDASNVGFSYDYRQRSSDTSFAQSEITAFLVHKFDKSWKAQAYLLKGFSDGSPDWGGGASIAYAF